MVVTGRGDAETASSDRSQGARKIVT